MNKPAEVIPFIKNEIEAFSEFKSQLATLKHDNEKAVFNYTDPKGNKEARSHIYKLRQTKSAVDRVRKEQKAESLEFGRRVDTTAKEISAEIEVMIAIHEEPLRAIEEKEAVRVEKLKERIDTMLAFEQYEESVDSVAIKELMSITGAIVIDDSFEEFKAEAALTKDRAITKLSAMLEPAIKQEAEAQELIKLREQAETQAKKDHEAKIAQQAREEAERKAQAKADQERRDREAEENRLRLEAEKAQREKLEAEKRARQAEENAKRQQAEAEQRAKESEERAAREIKEAADRSERERLEETIRNEAEQKRRENDKKHKSAINNAAMDALVSGGIDKAIAKQVITLIAKNEVIGVKINY